MLKKSKLIVILGPTASGKSDLAVRLAKKFNGEIISADSRQIYKGMDIGTGKITKKEMRGIPHYLLDVALPKKRFDVSQYQKLAFKAIKKIQKKGKIPFLVGGTGFYIQSVVEGIIPPAVKPNWKLRKKLEKEGVKKLYLKLQKLDPKRAKIIDKNNPRRLIRALEIILTTGKTIPQIQKNPANFKTLIIGIKKDKKELKKLIKSRLEKRLKKGMILEAKKLRKSGLSWERMEEFGLEYRYLALYLQKKITLQEMIKKLQKEIEHYAKRQMTWFKNHPSREQIQADEIPKINWVKNYKKARDLLTRFVGLI